MTNWACESKGRRERKLDWLQAGLKPDEEDQEIRQQSYTRSGTLAGRQFWLPLPMVCMRPGSPAHTMCRAFTGRSGDILRIFGPKIAPFPPLSPRWIPGD